MKHNLIDLLRAMIPVVLGVLIALFINSWKANWDNQRFIKRVLSSIEEELKENQASLEEIMPLQEAFLDTLATYKEDETVTIYEVFEKAHGFQVPSIKNTAWRSFLNEKIELVAYERISLLSDIEESKMYLNLKLEKMLEAVYNNSESASLEDKVKLEFYVYDLLDSEQGLLREHKAYLELGDQSKAE